ncbi:MAG: transglutaminase-like domain-containing protein [Candidatus Helarchaeota archaeon]
MSRKITKYLKATYGCESDSPEILNKLKDIVSGETDKTEIAKELFLWVRDNVRYELIEIIGAKNLLKRKSGACVDKSSLYIALCRAAGIPARYLIVTAQLITNKAIELSEINHCSTEIYLNDKWKIVDPTFDPSLISLFPQATFDAVNWWDIGKSAINYKTKEIDKVLSQTVSESYEKHELNIKFKQIIARERS